MHLQQAKRYSAKRTTVIDMENWGGKTMSEVVPNGGRGKRKRQILSRAPNKSSGPTQAGEIVAYGVKRVGFNLRSCFDSDALGYLQELSV